MKLKTRVILLLALLAIGLVFQFTSIKSVQAAGWKTVYIQRWCNGININVGGHGAVTVATAYWLLGQQFGAVNYVNLGGGSSTNIGVSYWVYYDYVSAGPAEQVSDLSITCY